MKRVALLPHVSAEAMVAFENIWVEAKSLATKTGDRGSMAAALRVLMPGGQLPDDRVAVYRGASFTERLGPRYGFSWTTDSDVARNYASQRTYVPRGAAVFATRPPPNSILLVRQKTSHFDEEEIVLDPFALNEVSIIVRL